MSTDVTKSLFQFLPATAGEGAFSLLLVSDGMGVRPCSNVETALYELIQKIESAATGVTGIPDKDKLVGIVQEIRKVIAE